MTTSKMMEVLEKLIDGKWHTLKEIRQETKLDENQIQQAMEFLKRYGFISVDKTSRKVKLDKIVQKFLSEHSIS